MKSRARVLTAFLLSVFICLVISQNLYADIDWTAVKQYDLSSKPMDVAVSDDGRMVFVLTKGEIIVYSPAKNNIFKRIPLDQEFDKIEYSTRGSILVLTSSTLNTLQIIRLDQIFPIDISGSAVKGPADAPVTIAVFDDYQ